MSEFWKEEHIPDDDEVYMRVHRQYMAQAPDQVPVGCFKDNPASGDGISTDWCKYATPGATQQGGRKPATEYAVIALPVGAVRAITSQPRLEVVHRPVQNQPDAPNNRAHALIHGPQERNRPRERRALQRISRLVIPPD